MNPIAPYYSPYWTLFFALSGETTQVQTDDGRILNLNDFAGLSIEQSNLMVCLKQPCVPETEFPLAKRIISSYTNRKDANDAFFSLFAAIQRGERQWNVNVFNQRIPYKVHY
jgi:hypothetical protein